MTDDEFDAKIEAMRADIRAIAPSFFTDYEGSISRVMKRLRRLEQRDARRARMVRKRRRGWA